MMRTLVVCLVQNVVPALLAIDWGEDGLDVDHFTLTELFAEVLKSKSEGIKRKVQAARAFAFGAHEVRTVLQRAGRWLEKNIALCGSEKELASGHHDIRVVRRQAMWPYAEYTGRFLDDGELVPAEFEVVNLYSAPREPTSRRGIREGGWLARDRFCSTKDNFCVGDTLVDYLASKPRMCGREYTFLFDKGVGSDMKVW